MIYDSPEHVEMQEKIRRRYLYSLAIFGKGAITRGGGKFLDIRLPYEQRDSERRGRR